MIQRPLLLLCCALPCLAQGEPPAELLTPEARAGLADALPRPLEALTHYAIDQALDDARGLLRGQVTVSFTHPGAEPLAALPLALHPNALADLGGAGQDAGALEVDGAEALDGPAVTWVQLRPSLGELRFAEPLAPGARVRVRVRYRGRLRVLSPTVNDPFAQAQGSLGSVAGTRAADYGLLGKGDGILTLAAAFPQVPPWTGAGFDTQGGARVGDLSYHDVARFDVRTVFPAGLTVVTNLLDEAPRPGQDGLALVESRGSVVRDLVLIAGRDLAQATRQVGATRVRSVFRPRDRAMGERALEVAADALQSFTRRFGPYPYRELEVAEASLAGGAGGVEFSGMILVAGMLYRDPSSSTSPLALYMKVLEQLDGMLQGNQPRGRPAPKEAPGAAFLREQLDFTVAHEVAHQYFHGLVGNDSLREAVIDEPLAQYLAGVALRDRLGEEEGQAAFVRNVKLGYALYRALGGSDRAAHRPTSTFATSIEYAALVYGKAPFLYAELERQAGSEALWSALREGVARHRFQVVSLADWTRTLAAQLPEQPVTETVRRYLDEAHGDADLGVDDSGRLVLEALFGEATARSVDSGLRELGITTRDYLRMSYGSLTDEGPLGGDIDLERALRGLGPRKR